MNKERLLVLTEKIIRQSEDGNRYNFVKMSLKLLRHFNIFRVEIVEIERIIFWEFACFIFE